MILTNGEWDALKTRLTDVGTHATITGGDLVVNMPMGLSLLISTTNICIHKGDLLVVVGMENVTQGELEEELVELREALLKNILMDWVRSGNP